MKVLISGSSGLIGSALIPRLQEQGHQVIRLVRSENQMSGDTLLWDPEHRELHFEDFEGFDVVINLAGENIVTGKWTPEKKTRIYDSRVLGTHMLSELLARLSSPPKLLINASAVGYYGSRGSKIMREEAAPGKGFLSDVCKNWEEATEPAAKKGIRVVRCRIGVVLTPKGGLLARLLVPFKFGLGGIIGTGRQYLSWVALDDLIGALLYIIEDTTIHGPLNIVAPNAVTNKVFTKTMGRVLRRPTLLPLPAFMARFLVGHEQAEALLLSSTRAYPAGLESFGYTFLYPELEGALKHLLEV